MSRTVSLTLLSAVAVPWAASLVVGGLWLAIVGTQTWAATVRHVCLVGGLTAIAAGQLVFTYCVADRLFPHASRTIVWLAEIPTCFILFAGFVWLVLTALGALALGGPF